MDFNKISKKYFLLIIMILSVLFGSGVMYGQSLSAPNSDGEGEILQPVASGSMLEKQGDKQSLGNLIYVDIKGAVAKPAVYGLAADSRLDDALELAQPLPEADLFALNKARKLADGEEIIVYCRDDIKIDNSQLETALNMPNNDNAEKNTEQIKASNPVKHLKESTQVNHNIKLIKDPAKNAINSQDKPASGGKININKADIGQLDTLPGIGPAKANAILNYRKNYGNFATIEEIMKVSGIGQSTFEKLKGMIAVD